MRMQPCRRREIISAVAIFTILFISYIYTFPRWADPNQNSRLDMVIAVVDDGTFQIDKYVDNTVDYAKVGEHYYSDKAPGTALLGIPFYGVLKFFMNIPIIDRVVIELADNEAFKATLREGGTGILEQKVRFAITQVVLTAIIVAIPSAILGVLLFLLLRKFTPSPGIRMGVVLGYALLTPAFPYGGAFYGHQLAAALLFAAFYIVFMREGKFSIFSLLGVGFLLGLSVLTEYPAILIVGILFLYTFYKLYRQHAALQILWVIITGSILAAVWMLYNNYIFGGPLELGYNFSEQWVKQHHTGFMSLTMPHWDALWGITFSEYRGLFFYAPLLLFIFPGFILWWRSRQYRAEFWVALLSSISMFLFNSSSIMWWGGFSIGPRYLLPALPFTAIALVFPLLQWFDRIWFKLVVVLLSIWSLVMTWGLTLAGQAFPSDIYRNPMQYYALPKWLEGDIARNLGTILGLPGLWSIVFLISILAFILFLWWLLLREKGFIGFGRKASS